MTLIPVNGILYVMNSVNQSNLPPNHQSLPVSTLSSTAVTTTIRKLSGTISTPVTILLICAGLLMAMAK